ncbi:Pectin lyase fold/virulence factor [Niveomyces insectorum RCEF 264]|uniref:Pectin lyase fold/virulence factor n=1 Tax=Niveomyces insectorum RCEF 264 TaxID=1081102 RepID=A0A167N981_9HYPO|nr:Pectin lyase fold/virulence factor [Niveomyces insectorum RCEF 264]
MANALHQPGDHILAPRTSSTSSSFLSNATTNDINAARSVVKDAIAKMTTLNKARLAKPARNRYGLRPGTKMGKRAATDDAPPPLLVITDEIAQAAALLAEVDALAESNITAPVVSERASAFWMEGISRKGSVPWGNDSGYKVFRNVVADYGADPSGKKDATAAIQKAIDDGHRCGEKCGGSTTKNAIVYFPPGKYLVSSSIKVYFGTQIIGDANNWPRIVAAASFVGLGVLSTDVYVDNGGNGPDGNALEWYINTARFYSQIRNMRIDITGTDAGASVCGIHYQVAQATSIQNIELIAKTGTTQQGMFSENGSGGVMSDITFTGGNFGFYGGNQQFSASRMTFNGCKTAVQIIWDWGWVWKSVTVNNADVGFRLINDDGSGNVGSVSFVDSTFSDIKTSAIVMAAPADKPGSASTGLILDNVNLGGAVWVIGPTYTDGKRTWLSKAMDYTRESTLLGPKIDGLQVAPYYERARNQYSDKNPGDFFHLKDGGAKGDGVTDDTAAVQATFNKYGDGSKIIFVDAGTYILTDTVTIPKDAKIVGETWAQFAASGGKFADPSKPRVVLKVGSAGDVGTVEMQDLLLTTKGGTAGAVLMEWNVRATTAGAAALWDVHARVGGATGTGLTPSECPPITSGTNPAGCQAASLLLHITPKASGYFDNMWLWVADHMIDVTGAGADLPQLSVYSARGLLVESQAATWLYGTASEHSVYYQYNFHNARNVFTTMIQSESPYYQPTPKPPAPFDKVVGKVSGDPDYSCKAGNFSGCDESWAVVMTGCENVHVGGAGTYSWFSTYTQDCIDSHTCQKALWYLDGNYNHNRLAHVVGIGAEYVLVADGKGVLSTDNLAVTDHPKWAHISLFEVPSKGKAPDAPGSGGDNPSPEAKCSAKDRMYSTEVMPAGNFTPWMLAEPENAAVSNKQYITIVNLTPYRFVKTRTHSYQFDTFDFGDIPSGKARQNTMVYTYNVNANPVDDNGEAYYRVDGTDKTFVIRGTTHIPDDYPDRTVVDLTGMGLGQREYKDPGQEIPVTLVITGSEDYGYITSLQFGPNDWMHQLYDVLKDRQLRHIVMSGSHDAGMSTISNAWIGLGDSSNTQTQGLGMYDQLRVGSRWFDMRLVSVRDGGYWAAHVNEETNDAPLGATGATLDSLIDDINKFTAESPGEIIVWWIKYMVDLNTNVPAGKGRYWNADKANDFYKQLERINNRCPGMSAEPTKFGEQKARAFFDKNGGAGCVLLMTDGRLQDGVPVDKTSSGIYHGPTYLDRDDYWAQKGDTESNSAAEIAHMNTITRDNGQADNLLIMQWQCTPDLLTANFYGLSTIGILLTNPALYWDAFNAMSPETWPSVILEDYIGYQRLHEGSFPDELGAEIRVLAIGLNLYMVSQNCDVSPGKHPLLRKPVSRPAGNTLPAFAGQGAANGHVFQGIIYANGTVDPSPPPGFHLGRAAVLKAGTVFDNGTVLTVDMPNPDLHAAS